MNTKFVASAVFAVAALTGASAFAQPNINPEAALAIRPEASSSAVTRAQVKSDYLNARQSGAVAVSQEGAFAYRQTAASTVSRAEVRSQAVTTARMQQGGRSAI
jgi:hypothetical protein